MEFVTTSDELRTIYKTPRPTDASMRKELRALDGHCRSFIGKSPFVLIGSSDNSGNADVTPKGDKPGFALVLDDKTIAIPDRPGNNRLDSLSNILSNPSIGLLFIIPGFDDTLRVSGEARLVTDPALLSTMTVNDRVPKLAIVVTVREVFMHCAKAFRRSHLWDPAHLQDRRDMPSLSKIILDQMTGAPGDDEMQKIDADLEEEYGRTMY